MIPTDLLVPSFSLNFPQYFDLRNIIYFIAILGFKDLRVNNIPVLIFVTKKTQTDKMCRSE